MVFVFQLQQGEPGDPGEKGLAGPPGQRGIPVSLSALIQDTYILIPIHLNQ